MDAYRLIELFPTITFLPGSSEYVDSNGSYFTAFENELLPDCILRPEKVNDVVSIINAFREVNSQMPKEHRAQFAVRGGGHTSWEGAANIHKGTTIDMRRITGIDIDMDNSIVSIGSGEIWSSVYSTLQKNGLAVAGARTSRIGVAGVILGGGLSFFSGRAGFICDNVVNFEVVLASGDIVNANADCHSDMFVALKGGSNNFGIVTRFDMRAFKQGDLWGGSIFYESQAISSLINTFHDFSVTSHPDSSAHTMVSISWMNGKEAGVANIYNSTGQAQPKSLKPFADIKPQIFQTLRKDTLLGFTEELSSYSVDGRRQSYQVTGFMNNAAFMLEVVDIWRQETQRVTHVRGLIVSLVFNPITMDILESSASLGQNILGLSPDQGPAMILLVNTTHADRSNDIDIEKYSSALITRIEQRSREEGLSHRYRFANYGGKGQNILESYGSENIRHMEEVCLKYDPHRMFQETVPGGYKLSAVCEK